MSGSGSGRCFLCYDLDISPFFLDGVINPSPALASGSRAMSLDRRDRSRSPVNPQGRSRSSTTARTTPRRVRRSNRGQGNP